MQKGEDKRSQFIHRIHSIHISIIHMVRSLCLSLSILVLLSKVCLNTPNNYMNLYTYESTCLRGTGSGFLWKYTGANGRKQIPRKPTKNLFRSHGNLRRSPETSGSLLGECNLGILYTLLLLLLLLLLLYNIYIYIERERKRYHTCIYIYIYIYIYTRTLRRAQPRRADPLLRSNAAVINEIGTPDPN